MTDMCRFDFNSVWIAIFNPSNAVPLGRDGFAQIIR
jgi:hypothetical protein